MAFPASLQFPQVVGKHVVFWDGTTSIVPGEATLSDIAFFDVGGAGALKEILILVEAVAASGTPAFNVFWSGATTFDLVLDLQHEFWTGVTTSTTNKTYFYYGSNTGTVNVLGGVGTVSNGMYNIRYLTFSWRNTGATDITARVVAVGVLV